jgi:hypothetical protein
MVRRLIGVFLCFAIISAAVSSVYAEAAKQEVSFELRFETSFVSLDPLDDSSEAPYPEGIVSTSPRGNGVIKQMPGYTVRKLRFIPPTLVFFERPAHSGLMSQDLFRYEKVYRI